ncbi:unnamed protein product [Schistosoma mattheei]|uniref:Uncharacterized protein n=1 Tax=Schistosoma mattheei TaxID=31246 RepID=A0A183NXK9_9TREM|nr:unnamed protein product [Schistosoma mattheei]
MLPYTGHEEENAPNTQKVALVLSMEARNALVGWESHGSRIIKASFKTKEEDLLKEKETTVDDNRKGIKEALTSTCQEVLSLKKHHHSEWITMETLDSIKERKNKKAAIYNSRTRAEKVQALAEYIEANKESVQQSFAELGERRAETWKTTTTIIKKVQVFINGCLLKIPSATAFCGRGQTSFQMKRKLVTDDGN